MSSQLVLNARQNQTITEQAESQPAPHHGPLSACQQNAMVFCWRADSCLIYMLNGMAIAYVIICDLTSCNLGAN